MRSRLHVILALVALLCLALACDEDATAPDPSPQPTPSQWSEWRDLPPSFTVYALWAASPSNVFAVGPAGTAARWNGARWTMVPVGLFVDVWSVTGIPGGPVVAVGDRGAALRFSGISFEPTPAVTTEGLRSVWAASADTLLAVGETGTLLLGDGSTWWLQPPPVRRSMFSIWGTSMRDVFAVGSDGLIVHFDGTEWREQPSGTLETLASVSGAASDDVFAVGTSGTILHYDGSTWTPMTSPSSAVLQCVVASGGDPIAVGANGTALVLEGGSWSRLDLDTTHWLYGACRTGGNTWVGGSRVIRNHDGTAWKSEASGTVPILRGVCTDTDGGVVAVGDKGYIARGRSNDWVTYEGVDARTLHCAIRTRSGDVFVGGLNRILHFDGMSWNVESEDFPAWYGFAESATNIYAVGSHGSMRRRSGSTWVNVPIPESVYTSLNAMAWTFGNEAYVVGDVGVVLRWSGAVWETMESRSSIDIRDVIENPEDDVDRRAFAVGESGAIFVLNARGVSAVASPTSANLYALAHDPNGDILAFGGGAAMLRYHDGSWMSEDSPVLQPLLAACWDEDEVLVVGGGVAGGLVLRYGPPVTPR